MDWSDLFTALGLAAVIEGVLYAAAPEATKRTMTEFMSLPTETRRRMALGIAIVGIVIISLARL